MKPTLFLSKDLRLSSGPHVHLSMGVYHVHANMNTHARRHTHVKRLAFAVSFAFIHKQLVLLCRATTAHRPPDSVVWMPRLPYEQKETQHSGWSNTAPWKQGRYIVRFFMWLICILLAIFLLKCANIGLLIPKEHSGHRPISLTD